MNEKVHIFFRDEMLYQLPTNELYGQFFYKPKLILSQIVKYKIADFFKIRKKWEPFLMQDFYIGHSKEYVDSFFQGKEMLCSTNGVPWNSHFVESICYMNASLYYAIINSIQNPEAISICPTGGFVKAAPERGGIFSTFSGQVIAALKIMNSINKKGGFIDLASFYPVAIPASRRYFFDNQVDIAIPTDAHVAPSGAHEEYIMNLKDGLEKVKKLMLDGKIDYLVFNHGADLHEWDDLGSKCTTDEWLLCSQLVYEMVKSVNKEMGKPFPFILLTDGGFRSDGMAPIISLHLASICQCLNILLNKKIHYPLKISSNEKDEWK